MLPQLEQVSSLVATCNAFRVAFRRFCRSRGITTPAALAKEVEFCLTGSLPASCWYATLSIATCTSWERLDAEGQQRRPSSFDLDKARDSYKDLLRLRIDHIDLLRAAQNGKPSPLQRFACQTFTVASLWADPFSPGNWLRSRSALN